MKDEIFLTPLGKQFEFDEGVASVFDDMAIRSIPHYTETLQLCVDFALQALALGGKVYDLGCSTGNFLLELASQIDCTQVELVGVDNSEAMIERASLKASAYGKKIAFICGDFLEIDLSGACVIVAHYTMQFVRPIQRAILLDKIYQALKSGGIFLMSEKMTSADKRLDKQMIERYHRYKQTQGYTQNEITSKREALENVLIPYSLQENFQMLHNAGFDSVEVLFKWVNFGTLIARKS
ncbi:carboxy-S-adenosyl-L-methionine synthase CmoA [Helicobacter sp. 12S02634-8]|uniref:carboxy-S-adenosyl-L-methionine synthase CmoA n=1 Tax=Helicobacter sp. 12S02634-8 TaxID=1476199 RepID=UPI000BA5ED98|nr:carboxy-S-adenosyl-L-methionine synthase CmoA [Helicobacter sp. 12S02634-8]PAF48056.1 carboxy-S-adenosyl-L-methionine synthase CmoA [Helicobacter sp. 12S02634-8]